MVRRMGSGGIAPPFLTSALAGGEWSASSLDRFAPGKELTASNGQEAGWAIEPVFTLLSLPGIEPPPSNPWPIRIHGVVLN
jgi:hypothetical protein